MRSRLGAYARLLEGRLEAELAGAFGEGAQNELAGVGRDGGGECVAAPGRSVSPANAATGLVAAVSRSARMTGWLGTGWMWPMFPATLTARPVSAVVQGQIRFLAAQPSR
jgi:hypothetical protein